VPEFFDVGLVENLRLAQPGATNEMIVEALKAAKVYEKIQDEFLGKFSIEEVPMASNVFTAADRQKIALARAFLGPPRALLVDDIGQGLSQIEEEEIYDAVDDFFKAHRNQMNLILVTRKMQTIKMADRIFVLEDGKIANSGSRDNIINQFEEDGMYANMVDLQTEVVSDFQYGEEGEGGQQIQNHRGPMRYHQMDDGIAEEPYREDIHIEHQVKLEQLTKEEKERRSEQEAIDKRKREHVESQIGERAK